ncbi:MAG: hypothetical protein MJ187_03230 [Alphaproteobacteria bacterium]|nr:hypothetical protein [Alphaproteobacteria bacterium]
MDKLSVLLQEARPLYQQRKSVKRTIRNNCVIVLAVLIMSPVAIHQYNNRTLVNDLYAQLYPSYDGMEYYIDEFDAMGII